ncbi:MAG: hypothetical protein RLP15_11775 [Cryomorphaceae bacterium]
MAISLLAITTSCATLISSSKQKVRFTSNVDSVAILIDDTETIHAGQTVKLKRRDEHHVKVDADGYESQSFTLKRTINGWLYANLICIPITGTAGWLLADFPYGPLSNDRPEPETTAGEIALGFSWLTPLFPMLIDAITGAAWKFDKEIDIQLTPIPQPFEQTGRMKSMYISEVNNALSRGDFIGSTHENIGLFRETLQWGSYVFVSNDSIRSQCLRLFRELNIRADTISNQAQKVVLSAKILSFEMDVMKDGRLDYKTECSLKVHWRAETPDNVMLFDRILSSNVTVQENGGPVPFNTALRHNLIMLVNAPTFREMLED